MKAQTTKMTQIAISRGEETRMKQIALSKSIDLDEKANKLLHMRIKRVASRPFSLHDRLELFESAMEQLSKSKDEELAKQAGHIASHFRAIQMKMDKPRQMANNLKIGSGHRTRKKRKK